MAKIFKPRRSIQASVKGGSKKTTILAAGELMVVSRGNSIGGGFKHDIYIGDGITQMQNLDPALYGDTSVEDITVTADASATATAALSNVVTGRTLGALIGSLKQAIIKTTSEINDRINTIEIDITGDLDQRYAQINHTHTGYAPTDHNHDGRYWMMSTAVGSTAVRLSNKFDLTGDSEGGNLTLYAPNGTGFMQIDHHTNNEARIYFTNNGSTVSGTFTMDPSKSVSYANMKNFATATEDGETVLRITDI